MNDHIKKKIGMSDAKIVMFDPANAYYLAWYGGDAIHAYSSMGNEFSLWTIDWKEKERDEDSVMRSMLDRIQKQDYTFDG